MPKKKNNTEIINKKQITKEKKVKNNTHIVVDNKNIINNNVINSIQNISISNNSNQISKSTDVSKNIKNKELQLTNIPKPFLKWVGGKTQIIDNVINNFPKKIINYHEPFLGGGSVLLALLFKIHNGDIKLSGKIYVYDLNEGLINLYNNIKNNKDELFKLIQKYIKEYDSILGSDVNRNPNNLEEAKTSKESYYYYLRKKFNKTDKSSLDYSALFLVLNKLCFRGVYREGPNGFNVPYGHYKTTPGVISELDIKMYSKLFKNVIFRKEDFTKSMTKINKGDFVYLDPPYAPENAKSFVGYTKDGFGLENHKKLFDLIKSLHNKKIKFMMSNAKVDLVTTSFQNNEYKITDIEAKRSIHSKNPGTKTTEVIITNY
tara:strand:+ start:186 stop:1310 length:1125 start_codon:yes stop_codon:yes gene_type:complete